MKWLIGVLAALAVLGGFAWWAVFDGAGPQSAEGEFDLAAYRALVANDAPESLPTEIRVERIGNAEFPSFATEAGAFDGKRAMVFPSFQVIAPSGDTIIDTAVDHDTNTEIRGDEGGFDEAAFTRMLNAEEHAAHILVTHEHLDHVMGVARHPHPDAIAPALALSAPQLAALPQYAPNGLAPSIANAPPLDLSTLAHIAPGIVVAAAPGHAPGEIVVYVRTNAHEYLFIGDIAWMYSSVENVRGRPRFIRWLMSAIDPDRPAVLRQLRALHDMAAANPELIIVPSHDANHLQDIIDSGAMTEQFQLEQAESAASASPPAPVSP